jgi:hypothetical protein
MAATCPNCGHPLAQVARNQCSAIEQKFQALVAEHSVLSMNIPFVINNNGSSGIERYKYNFVGPPSDFFNEASLRQKYRRLQDDAKLNCQQAEPGIAARIKQIDTEVDQLSSAMQTRILQGIYYP